jgi:hypothetical protein
MVCSPSVLVSIETWVVVAPSKMMVSPRLRSDVGAMIRAPRSL